jgi:hypothetical protein
MVTVISEQRKVIDNCLAYAVSKDPSPYKEHWLQAARDSVERIEFLLWMCVRCGFPQARSVATSALALSSDQRALLYAQK